MYRIVWLIFISHQVPSRGQNNVRGDEGILLFRQFVFIWQLTGWGRQSTGEESKSQIWTQNAGICSHASQLPQEDAHDNSWHFWTGGVLMCDVTDCDDNMAITLIKDKMPDTSLCRCRWSLSSWINDYLQWNNGLNKGAAGKVCVVPVWAGANM